MPELSACIGRGPRGTGLKWHWFSRSPARLLSQPRGPHRHEWIVKKRYPPPSLPPKRAAANEVRSCRRTGVEEWPSSGRYCCLWSALYNPHFPAKPFCRFRCLLFPYPALHALELVLRHSVAGGEISCEGGVKFESELGPKRRGRHHLQPPTGVDLGINLDSRVGGDPRLGEFDSLVDRDTVFWGYARQHLSAGLGFPRALLVLRQFDSPLPNDCIVLHARGREIRQL